MRFGCGDTGCDSILAAVCWDIVTVSEPKNVENTTEENMSGK
jgi:hypothetical protein